MKEIDLGKKTANALENTLYIRKEIVSFETLTLDNDIQFSNKDRKRLWTVNL